MKYIFIMMVTLWSCVSSCSSCKIDDQFQKRYNNCLHIIERVHGGGYSSDFETRCYAFECLYAITGYEGKVDKGNESHCFYQSYDDMEVDLAIWRGWYEDNKCSFTMSIADSLIREHSISNRVESLTWPISADSLKYVKNEYPDLF